jgi:HAE1 family hydrophobic/amphiphilic exporter-1
MRQFSIVMVTSTLFSLLVSFTVTPVLASRISKLEHLTKDTLMGRFGIWFEGIFKRVSDQYIELLKWALQNRWKVATSAVLMLIASCSLIPLGFIGGEFIAQTDRGEFSVALELAPGTKLEETNAISQKIERMLMDIPEVEKVSANVGASSDGFITASSSNIVDISVKLLDKEERAARGMRPTTDVQMQIKQMTKDIPGVKVRVNDIGIFGTANQTPIQLVVSGADYDSVKKGALQLKEILKGTKGATDVRLSAEDGNPETRIEIDRNKLAFFGLSIAEVGASMRIALAGDNDAKFREGDTEYDIRIQLDEFDRSSTDNIGSLTFVNQRGQVVELKQFANIYQATGPTKLQRRDRNYAIIVYAQLAGRSLTSVWQDAKLKLADYPLPVGVNIAPLGDLKNQQEGFGSLGLALVAGVLFVYLIMVALYNSYKYPFVVLFSIPLAVIGALLAIAMAGKNLSIFTILGFIMLLGLVSKNAILLVDFANRAKEEGLNTVEALVEAGRERLRPILMTTLTMIFGMMPIALSGSAGAEWKTGLAWALIGGLTSSMFLTLVIVPVVYYWFDNFGNAFAKLRVRKPVEIKEGVFEPVPEVVKFEGNK